MPISTNLNVSPYHDDFDVTKNYHKILFQPGVSVQTRELNQLQSILQNQIEKFGDNIFTSGTIISGCNLLPLSPFPYVKINDKTTEGGSIAPSSYLFFRVKNESTGLMANIIDYADGFQSSDPDLKTLYVNYVNTGDDADFSAFAPGDTLLVYNGTVVGVEKIIINNGSSGFSNNDLVIAVPQIAVTVASGTFTVGDFVTNGAGANLEIIAVDTTSLADSNQVVLGLKPRVADLANSSLTETAWTLSLNESILDLTSGAQATVTQVIGSGFKADALTDPNGTIVNINITNKGFGYTFLPYITLQSYNNSGGIDTLQGSPPGLIAQNWLAEVTIASTANAVGNGYAFAVGEGTVYQKGYFLRVAPQLIVVDKYSTEPDGVFAGFTTIENIITPNVDQTLNDPQAGGNSNAPGANRLQLVPQLVVLSAADAEANSEFLPIAEWNNGNIYYTRQKTLYSTIGDKIAEGILDSSGDFYIDPFLVTTQSPISNDTPASFDIIIDPGVAYIQGYKVATQSNYNMNYPASFLNFTQNNYSMSLNYECYVKLNNIGGTFQFNTGDSVTLYDTAKSFISNSSLVQTQNTNPVGTAIGTMRMRSLILDTFNPTNPVYKLYVFDVQMANGKNFADTRSIYYNGTQKGIADIITSVNVTTSRNEAKIANAQQSSLVFPVTSTILKNVANTTYTFRTVDTSLTVNTSGYITKSIAANGSWFFPYTANLNSGQLTDLYIVPTTTDWIYAANATGTIYANSGTANVIGGSTAFLSDLAVGDWIYIYGNATYNLKQVQSIVNNTFLTVDSAPSFMNAASSFARCFPKNVPIPLGYRSGLTANVNTNQDVLTINLGGALTISAANTATGTFNINQVNITQGTKSPTRNRYVKLNLSTHPQSNTGPWCLGVPDAFRLKGVYIGNSSVDDTGSNYFQNFYIDNNQTVDYYGLSWLYIKPTASLRLTTSDYVLVKFDYFTSDGLTYYNPVSYIGSNTNQIISIDSLTLGQLDGTAGAVNTWEIPEFFTTSGGEIDLFKCLDFRLAVANTCAPSATIGSAPTNPDSTKTFNSAEKYFPVPGATLTTNMQSWLGNFVTLFIDKDATITASNSTITGSTITSATTPPENMKIADIIIPAYPAIPQNRSVRLTEIMNTGVINLKYASMRPYTHIIMSSSSIQQNQTKVYTQSDFATMDRRLQNVEYYVSLTQTEAEMNNLVIPSSNDPALARYKFGFFSDVFENPKYLDTGNPQFAASNKSGYEWPSRLDWDVFFGDIYSGPLPYVLEDILDQTNATIGTFSDPTATPQCAIEVANAVAYQLTFRNVSDLAGYFAPQEGAIDTVNLTLADQTHMTNAASFGLGADRDYWTTTPSNTSVELYFYCYDNPVKIEIWQGNTHIVNTASAQNLTAIDISNLTGSSSHQWFNDDTSLYMKNHLDVGDGYVMYAGKIVWNYNGTGGRNISIRTTNGAGVTNWRWVISYPINGETAPCTPPPPPPVTPPPVTPPPVTPPSTPTTVVQIDIFACGNAFWDALASALMRAISLNGGTTQGLDGTIDYSGPLREMPTTGGVDLSDYLSDPAHSNLILAAWEFSKYTDEHLAATFRGSETARTSGPYTLILGDLPEVINNQVVRVWYWLNPTTGTLVITTSSTSASSGVIQTITDWQQTITVEAQSSVVAYTANRDLSHEGISNWSVQVI